MGLEFHGGRPYFYRKRRDGDRVVSEYIGGGLIALVAAELAEIERAEKAAGRGRLEGRTRAAGGTGTRRGRVLRTGRDAGPGAARGRRLPPAQASVEEEA